MTRPAPSALELDGPCFASYRSILRYALPLILSNAGGVLLQFVDRLFLAWHGPESVAGAGTAGMIALCFIAFCAATCGFTSVFAAQYLGAGRPERLGPIIWQGWYLALVFGLGTLALSGLSEGLFDYIGHGPAVRAAEVDYFRVFMIGGFFFMALSALMGFFMGRGDTRVVMVIQLGGLALNAILDYGLIFGRWGLPAWGVAGAAWATVLAEAAMLAVGLALFWRADYRRRYRSASFRLEFGLVGRLLRFGLPGGLRAIVEVAVWALFLSLIGQLGDQALAVSNVAFTINSLAWQPMAGVGMAVAMLVGQAQGAGRPELSRRAMRRGWALTQVWETGAALAIVIWADPLLGIFFRDLPPDRLEDLLTVGRMVLWFVAAYCLIDGVNVVLAQALVGAGDSWWIFKATTALSLLAAAAMIGLSLAGASLAWYWLTATAYVAVSGLAWIWRYHGQAWESMQVVEPTVT